MIRPDILINLGREQEARIVNERAYRVQQDQAQGKVDKPLTPSPRFHRLINGVKSKIRSSR